MASILAYDADGETQTRNSPSAYCIFSAGTRSTVPGVPVPSRYN